MFEGFKNHPFIKYGWVENAGKWWHLLGGAVGVLVFALLPLPYPTNDPAHGGVVYVVLGAILWEAVDWLINRDSIESEYPVLPEENLTSQERWTIDTFFDVILAVLAAIVVASLLLPVVSP